MRKSSRILPTLAAGLILTYAACGGDGPTGTNSGDALSQAEAQEIADIFLDELGGFFLFGIGGSPSVMRPSFSSASPPISESINETSSCEGGGNTQTTGSISGNIDDQTFEGNISFDITTAINDCVAMGTTTSFTLNSNPDLAMTGELTFSQTSISGNFTISGGIGFTSEDGRSGSCAISVTTTVSSSTGGTASSSVSGTVCGHNVTT